MQFRPVDLRGNIMEETRRRRGLAWCVVAPMCTSDYIILLLLAVYWMKCEGDEKPGDTRKYSIQRARECEITGTKRDVLHYVIGFRWERGFIGIAIKRISAFMCAIPSAHVSAWLAYSIICVLAQRRGVKNDDAVRDSGITHRYGFHQVIYFVATYNRQVHLKWYDALIHGWTSIAYEINMSQIIVHVSSESQWSVG